MSAGLDPVRVECDFRGSTPSVRAVGIDRAGTTPVEVALSISAKGFSIFVPANLPIAQDFLATTDPTAVTLSATGTHISGTARDGNGSNSLQLTGDLVCGVTDR